MRSDFYTNNSDCLITRVVLGNTSCGSDNESYDHEQDSKNAFVLGKHRLILDLRYVNDHLEKRKAKFEDWKTFQNYISSENYLFKFDLKSGYHHIEIFQQHLTYFIGKLMMFPGIFALQFCPSGFLLPLTFLLKCVDH